MAKLILASVLCIFLLVKGTEAQAAGAACGEGDVCAAEATCEGGTCMANLGETCTAGTIDCVTGATCDTTCKKSAGATGCTATGNTVCVSTATCQDSTCVANLGETCSVGTIDCVTGATCQGTTCMANLGETCSAGTIDCVTGATCEGTTCRKNAGTSGCSTTGKTLCVSTATCEGSTCVANLGESCAGSITCVTDTECDTSGTDSICRTKVTKAGGACSEQTTFCDSTLLTCDGEKCKIQAEKSCATATTECTAHAECDTTCKCSATYKADSGVCVGTKTLGQECANDNCAPDFVCDGGECKTKLKTLDASCGASVTDKACDPTTLACQNDKCKWKIEQECTDTDQCVTGAKCEVSGDTKQCNCPMGVQPSSDKAQCGGAMGIAASMLLVVATFVTSRFL